MFKTKEKPVEEKKYDKDVMELLERLIGWDGFDTSHMHGSTCKLGKLRS